MNIDFRGKTVEVFRREHVDGRIDTDSTFFYRLKQKLELYGVDLGDGKGRQTFQLVKKLMCKDGHMVGSEWGPHYVREKNWKFCIHDPQYAIREIKSAYNRYEVVKLELVVWPPSSNPYITRRKP